MICIQESEAWRDREDMRAKKRSRDERHEDKEGMKEEAVEESA